MTLPVVPRDEIHDFEHFKKFSARVPTFSFHRPLDPVEHNHHPKAYAHRINHTILDIDLPDGTTIETWVFDDGELKDPQAHRTFPAPMIRLTEGDLFHGYDEHHLEDNDEPDEPGCVKQPAEGHTIHWHGIEPVTSSDGVGKLSFGVRGENGTWGEYTYQWRAADAGTYFYHCHRNTVLHFEMGMYGGLVIDPPAPPLSLLQPPYPTGGPGYVRRGDELVRYDVERIWIADDMDRRWHEELKCGEDSGLGGLPFNDPKLNEDLHRFEPDIFLISGVPHPWTRNDPEIYAKVAVGDVLLLRVICASYVIQTWTLGIDAEVIAMDGRTLGNSKQNPYSSPFILPAGKSFELTTARRWDLLVRPTAPGKFPVLVEMRPLNVGLQDRIGHCETFIHAG